MRLHERRLARRYWHRTPWRSCNDTMRGFCLSCWWRGITGARRKALAAHIGRSRMLAATCEPIKYRKGQDGRWERVR